MSLNDQENTMSVDLGVSNQQQFHYHYSRAEIKVMQFLRECGGHRHFSEKTQES
jgi:hypothetical protein